MRIAGIGAVLVALATGVILGVQRYQFAMVARRRPDWDACFLPAAQEIAGGRTPYSVECYVYSPLYALLIAPVANDDHGKGLITALLIVAGILAALIISYVITRGAPLLTFGMVALAANATLLFNYAIAFDLQLMGPELLVLLAMALALLADAMGRQFWSGAAIAVAAGLKTWPAAYGLWLIRSPVRLRVGAWTGVATVALLVIASALITGGPAGVVEIVDSAVGASSQPKRVYSVIGASWLLFSDNPVDPPIIDSPVLQAASLIILLGWVLGLTLLLLYRPGNAIIALFNLAFCVNLLLPVSHYKYALLALPALWWWFGALMLNVKSPAHWIGTGTLAAWFVVVLGFNPTYTPYLQTLAPTLVATTVSVVLASRLPQPIVELLPNAPQRARTTAP